MEKSFSNAARTFPSSAPSGIWTVLSIGSRSAWGTTIRSPMVSMPATSARWLSMCLAQHAWSPSSAMMRTASRMP